MYLNIEYRDGKTEQKIVDDCTVKDGCLKYYIRTGRDAGTHYIPLDIIKEFHKENQHIGTLAEEGARHDKDSKTGYSPHV